MKAPKRLQALIDEGFIDSVQRQLMSGKEAMVFVVRCGDETRCAKVYKEATQRSFRQAVDYTENRKVKNTRQARAMAKGTRFGKQAQEAAWQSAEVDALYRLAAVGVRVPRPYNFHDGVLLMELVADEDGGAAPRLNDVAFTAEQARAHHEDHHFLAAHQLALHRVDEAFVDQGLQAFGGFHCGIVRRAAGRSRRRGTAKQSERVRKTGAPHFKGNGYTAGPVAR